MTLIRICAALATGLAAWSFSGQATAQTSQLNSVLAELFKVGEFDEARSGYARAAKENPDDYSAVLQLQRVPLIVVHSLNA